MMKRPLGIGKNRQISGNLIHCAYYLFKFKQLTNKNATDINVIFEFGGGYCSVFRVFRNANFKKNI